MNELFVFLGEHQIAKKSFPRFRDSLFHGTFRGLYIQGIIGYFELYKIVSTTTGNRFRQHQFIKWECAIRFIYPFHLYIIHAQFLVFSNERMDFAPKCVML